MHSANAHANMDVCLLHGQIKENLQIERVSVEGECGNML